MMVRQANIPNSMGVTSPDMINTANTNVIPVGDDIWALWEAGSATRLTKNLETKGIVTLGDGLNNMPFSAHPKMDPNGDIWNFGLDYSSGRIVIYHLSPEGRLLKTGLINSGYHGMLHDFLMTEKHLLFILPSLDFSGKGDLFFTKQSFNAQQPVRLLIVDKNSLTVTRTHELPPGFMFHFGNAYEDTDGSLHFDCCRYDNFDIMESLGHIMQGKNTDHLNSTSRMTVYHITKKGDVTEERIEGDTEFPRIYPRMAGLKNRYVFNLTSLSRPHWFDTVRRIDMTNGHIDHYHYGKDYLVEEHVLVESNAGHYEKNGWLVGTALHWPSKRTCINIFSS